MNASTSTTFSVILKIIELGAAQFIFFPLPFTHVLDILDHKRICQLYEVCCVWRELKYGRVKILKEVLDIIINLVGQTIIDKQKSVLPFHWGCY